MSKLETRVAALADRWLLLIHQLPANPAYLRVKVWRRLQAIGAVGVKNSVYALPYGEQTQEDLEWLLKEIAEGGGEAMLCEARFIGGLSDMQIRALFNAARDADYEALAKDVRQLMEVPAEGAPRPDPKPLLSKLKARLAQVVAIDFFGANGREAADGLLAKAEADLERARAPTPEAEAPVAAADVLTGRIWVTRQGVQVDRIASAWLIRRFIDPAASFKFVPGRGYVPDPGELRFDMFEAEFTHEGDRCTFEVLLDRVGSADPALAAIAEIVHDIDLKDGKFGREEAGGIRTLIAGIALATGDDSERIARGSAVLEDLYGYFRKQRG